MDRGQRQSQGCAIACLLCLVLGSTAVRGQTYFRFNGAGVGVNAGLANPDGFDAAIGSGIHALLEWDLGEPGMVHYYPSVDYWFRPATRMSNRSVTNWGMQINPLGVSYYFPAPDDFPLQVNAGFDIGATLQYEVINYHASSANDTRTTTPGIGIGVFGGINLVALHPFVPFAELKLTLGTNVIVRTSLGFNIRFATPPPPVQPHYSEPIELYDY